MKKTLLAFLVFPFMLFESCSDDFNINAPYQDEYVLNCILRNDSSIQYAVITKNLYTKDGTIPPANSRAANVKGADIKIFNNGSVYYMRDTTIQLIDSGNQLLIDCYYVKNLVIIPGSTIRIEAVVPDGKKLESSIQVPTISYYKFQPNFPQLFKSFYQARPNYSWNWIGDTEVSRTILNLPQLVIHYKKNEEGTYTDGKILVPLSAYFTLDENKNLVSVDVKLSFSNFCITTLDAVNKTMQEISGNDPDKKNYVITKVLFNVISFDSELSKYYSAYNVYSEDFTIKLRQTDFSNIKGGKGIFGVYYIFSNTLDVDALYVNSFGYQYNPE